MNNFLGKDNYVWWVGVVENINDPLQLGRCQVRIFGWHSENKNDIPTKDLPWAQASFSPSSSNKWSVPNYGDYVTGFFGDGMSAQMPIMTGVMPGIFRSANADSGSSGNSGFQDGRTPEQKAAGPQMPAGEVRYVDGQPTTPPLARGIVANTGIAKTNADRVHVCDVTGNIKYTIALVSLKIGQVIQQVRAALAALWTGASSSPFADEVRATIKAIKGKIKLVQKFVSDLKTKLAAIQDFIAQVKQLIQYIQNLPANLAKMLAQCLADATASLKDAIKNAESIVKSSSTTDAANNISSTTSSLNSTVVSNTSSLLVS